MKVGDPVTVVDPDKGFAVVQTTVFDVVRRPVFGQQGEDLLFSTCHTRTSYMLIEEGVWWLRGHVDDRQIDALRTANALSLGG